MWPTRKISYNTYNHMDLILSFSAPDCFSPRFLYFRDAFSSLPTFPLASKLSTPGLLQNCSQKSLMTSMLLPPMINSQASYLTSEQSLSWLITLSSLIHSFRWITQPLGSSPTYVVSLLVPPLFPTSECWITQGLGL